MVEEISKAKKQLSNDFFIIGHGQGSFGHVPAQTYQTIDGFINHQSRFGMAVVLDSVARLNQIVVHEFLKHHLPAVSLRAASSIITEQKKAKIFFSNILEAYLRQGLIPITCGDVLIDHAQGCTIWSTEEILSFFAQWLLKKKMVYRINHSCYRS